MTKWQFDNGASVVTVASNSSSVTYEVPSLSTEHTGVYYCETIIDGITDTSINYTLFGEFVYTHQLYSCTYSLYTHTSMHICSLVIHTHSTNRCTNIHTYIFTHDHTCKHIHRHTHM